MNLIITAGMTYVNKYFLQSRCLTDIFTKSKITKGSYFTKSKDTKGLVFYKK